MKWLIVASSLLLASCTQPRSPLDGAPGCDETKYLELFSGYMGDLTLQCSGYKSLADCPEMVKAPVRKAWKEKFDAWSDC